EYITLADLFMTRNPDEIFNTHFQQYYPRNNYGVKKLDLIHWSPKGMDLVYARLKHYITAHCSLPYEYNISDCRWLKLHDAAPGKREIRRTWNRKRTTKKNNTRA